MTSLSPAGLPTSPAVDPADPAFAGQAVYTREFLARVYDPLVVRYTNRFAWRCPSTRLVKMYNEHVTAAHLDVGPGTGYYLDRCRFPSQTPALTLLDPNPNVLAAASARIKRYAPSVVAANVLEPIDLEAERFDSIGLSHVLHCLPGTIASKARAFEHLQPLLKPGGVIFGSTVVATGVRHSVLSRRVMASLNEKGVFSNTADDPHTLESVLATYFSDVQVTTQGTVALFSARRD
jgi:SAM-dependent methyltransferase